MALLYMDSFDHESLAGRDWTQIGGGTVTLSAGRFGDGATHTNINRGIRYSLSTYYSTLIVGIAFRMSSLSLTFGSSILTFQRDGTPQNFLAVTNAGALVGGRNQSGSDFNQGSAALVSSSSGLIAVNTWNYVEVLMTTHDSAGVITIRLNGVEVATGSSLDTQVGGTPNQIEIFGDGGGGASTWIVDDLYVVDTSGSAPTNTFLGDCRVELLVPNGNGNASELDGSDGNSTDNYLLVDELPEDEDTTYVESDTLSDKDTYTYSNLSTISGTVYGVQTCPRWRKTDAGARSAATVARLSGTEVDSSDVSLSTTYSTEHGQGMIRETKPGGGAWTVTDVNDAEFGVKVTV